MALDEARLTPGTDLKLEPCCSRNRVWPAAHEVLRVLRVEAWMIGFGCISIQMEEGSDCKTSASNNLKTSKLSNSRTEIMSLSAHALSALLPRASGTCTLVVT
jgi:hypothetical protein